MREVPLSALLIGLVAAPMSAQEGRALAIACSSGSNPEVTAACQEAVLSLEAFRAGVGLSLTQGSDIPGFSSTIGRGLGGRPLVTATARVGLVRFKAPDFAGPGRPLPADVGTLNLATVQVGVAVGLLNGFASGPSTRGILSLDLLGSAALSRLPAGDGFRGNVLTYGYGVRLGILKESFAVPGISVSVMRRGSSGDVTVGRVGDEDRAQVIFDPSVLSIRATVGKDFLRAGVMGGVGLDRYDGDAEVRVFDPLAPGLEASASTSKWATTRPVLFAGFQFTYLIFQTSLEVGWADGFGDFDGYTGDYDPSSGSGFANLGVRLTFR